MAVVTIYGMHGAPGNELAVIDVAKAPSRRRSRSVNTRGRMARCSFPATKPASSSRRRRRRTSCSSTSPRVGGGRHPDRRRGLAYGRDHGRWQARVHFQHRRRRRFGARPRQGRLVRVIPVAPRVEGIAVTPDGSAVWAGSNTDGTVSIIDTKTGTSSRPCRVSSCRIGSRSQQTARRRSSAIRRGHDSRRRRGGAQVSGRSTGSARRAASTSRPTARRRSSRSPRTRRWASSIWKRES